MDSNIPQQVPSTPVSQAPIQQPQQQNYSTPSLSSSKMLIGIIMVLVIVIIGMGIYMLGIRNNKQVSTQPVQQTSKISIPSMQDAPITAQAPLTVEQTSNWKTYTNGSLFYSIKYPPAITVNERSIDYVQVGDQITILVSTVSPLNCKGDCPNITKLSDVTINGIKMTKLEGEQGAIGGNTPGQIIEYIIPKGNSYFLIEYQQNNFGNIDGKTFNQILSTFKFTDQDQTKVLVPADTQIPISGTCLGPTADKVVVVIFGLDNVAQPRCTKVTANQKLKIINNKDKTIQGAIGQYVINIVPRQE